MKKLLAKIKADERGEGVIFWGALFAGMAGAVLVIGLILLLGESGAIPKIF